MKIRIEKSDDLFAGLIPTELSVESEVERKKLMIVESLLEIMEQKGVSRSELARRMGVVPSRITSMLDTTNNFTIDTLVRAGRAVGAELHQAFVSTEKKVELRTFESYGIEDIEAPTIAQRPKQREPRFQPLPAATQDDPVAA